MALQLTERPYVPRAHPTLFASRLLAPLINFSSTISRAPADPQRGFSVLLHLTYATGNIPCNGRLGLKSIAAFCDPILPSSYGLILSECGGNRYLHRRRTGPFYERLPYGLQKPSPPTDEKWRRRISSPQRSSAQLGIRHLLRETTLREIGWMDHEGLALSTILPGAAAHRPSDAVASVIDGSLVADDRGVLAAEAARKAVWSGETRHELPAIGHGRTSRVVAAATCRISLRNAGRDGPNTGFRLWGDPYHVVKQACDRADVLAEQGRFAPVRGKVSC
jgi:hypothetical protein